MKNLNKNRFSIHQNRYGLSRLRRSGATFWNEGGVFANKTREGGWLQPRPRHPCAYGILMSFLSTAI